MNQRRLLAFATALTALPVLVGCTKDPEALPSVEDVAGEAGEVGLKLQLTPGFSLDSVTFTITGPNAFVRTGSFGVGQSNTVAITIPTLPAGSGYSIALSGTTTKGNATCGGAASFDVVAHQVTPVLVGMACHEAAREGSVLVNGSLNVCAVADGISASPSEVLVGGTLSLSALAHDTDAGPQPISYGYTASSGTLSDAQAQNPTFTCTEAGQVTIAVRVSDGDPAVACADSSSITVTCSSPGGGGTGGSSGSGGVSGSGSGGAGAGAGGAGAGGAGAGGAGADGAGAGGAAAGGAGAGGAGGSAPAALAVFRVGDGSAGLGSAATPVFIDYFTAAGSLHHSVAMPTAVVGSNHMLTSSGTATSDGELTRSADGRYLVVPGYDAAPGTASVASFTGSRVVGRVSAAGSIDTTTALSDLGTNNHRSAASVDGTAFWVGSAATGVRFATLGATTSTQLSTTVTNVRQVALFGGQLYVSDGSGSTSRLGAVGTGLPTTSGNTIVSLPGYPATVVSPYGFFFADLTASVAGLDTLYVADDTLGITKYSLVSGTWTSNGVVGAAADTYRGLTAAVTAGVVTLYATGLGGSGATGGGKLVTLTDASGYNAAFTGTPTVLASAASQTAFRGVALVPE